MFPFNSSIGLLFKSYIEKYLLLKEENSLAMVGGTILLQSKQSTYCYAICAYKNKIDFANYNKIKLTYTCKKSALVGINSIIPASPTISGDIFNIYLSETSTFTETAIDIANLKTSGYLFFRTNVYQSEINITKIELE